MRIVIFGEKGSGKDTVGNMLKEKLKEWDFELTAFAAPLKKIAKDIFDLSDESLYGPSKLREIEDVRYPFAGVCPACHCHAPYRFGTPMCINKRCYLYGEKFPRYLTPRLILQSLGTEWGRSLFENVWANLLLRSTKEGNWIVTDGRFENEASRSFVEGCFTIKLLRKPSRLANRSFFQWLKEKLFSRFSNRSRHPSETSLDTIPDHYFTVLFDNNVPLDELSILIDLKLMPMIINKLQEKNVAMLLSR